MVNNILPSDVRLIAQKMTFFKFRGRIVACDFLAISFKKCMHGLQIMWHKMQKK